MIFKDYIDSVSGLRYMYDTLDILSASGRRVLLNTEFIKESDKLVKYYNDLKEISLFIDTSSSSLLTIQNVLNQFNDIKGSIDNLANSNVLDDIELYEIKMLAIQSFKIKCIADSNKIKVVDIPDLSKIIDLLDPDNLKVPSFYIYDSYSGQLKEYRKLINSYNIKKEVSSLSDEELKELGVLVGKANIIEVQVRESLSNGLLSYADDLYKALESVSMLDILIAKSKQITKLKLSIPSIANNNITSYRGLFHPQIRESLLNNNKEFCPIDISFGLDTTSIIGANMGGKTVVLKMVVLSQLLFQFGFGIPTQSAVIDLKDDVLFSIGDNQNELQGLSSFAAEIKDIDYIIKKAENGDRILALIDEPARTTNPVEGTALVSALIKLLDNKNISLIITTHYRIADNLCKRLKVRGLINKKMDYTLYEPLTGEVPHEAIDIARELGASVEWLELTKNELNKKIN